MFRHGQQVHLPEIYRRIQTKLLEQGITDADFPRDLYMFGINNHRGADVFLSPDLPNVNTVAEYLTGVEVVVQVGTVGNPAPTHWMALSLRLRTQEDCCARIAILTWLHINNAVTW